MTSCILLLIGFLIGCLLNKSLKSFEIWSDGRNYERERWVEMLDVEERYSPNEIQEMAMRGVEK